MNSCNAPLSPEVIVAYLAGELDAAAQDAFEQHLFGCASCTGAVERLAQVSSAISETIAPALTAGSLDQLRRALRVRETPVQPGQDVEVLFSADVDLLVHTLRAGAPDDRIDLEVYGPDDQLFMRVEAVPYDAQAGAVHVACQRHMRGDLDVEDTRFRLVTVRGGASRVLGDYRVRHHWNPSV